MAMVRRRSPVHHFQSNPTIETRVIRRVDLAHPASPDETQHGESSYRGPRCEDLGSGGGAACAYRFSLPLGQAFSCGQTTKSARRAGAGYVKSRRQQLVTRRASSRVHLDAGKPCGREAPLAERRERVLL
jgi:hypothetical protein